MPELAQSAGIYRRSPVLACLGAAALASTLIFTANTVGAAEPEVEIEPLSVTIVDETSLPARSVTASRTGVRSELGQFETVVATPAPIWCAFTGLSHLPETDELCSHPSQNTPEQNRTLGEYLTAARGWVGEQWQCMDSLMTRESRWRHNAANPVTAARGIPQKMMSVHYGAGWRESATAAAWMADPEAQIEWGLNYIERRYTTPCGAWNFFLRNGWY